MDAASGWRQLFENWPASIPRKATIVTAFQETIGFVNFMVTDGVLVLERERPDTIGARKVMLSYPAISAVKFTDTEPFENLKEFGAR